MSAVERVAVGFPGQGGDWLAALRTIDANPEHPLVQQLRAALGDRLAPSAQTDVRVSQPTVMVAGLVAVEAAGLLPGSGGVAAAIGHSLGELTACAFAGAVDATAAVELAIQRGELSHAAQQQNPGAMILVTGAEEAQVEWLRRRVEHAVCAPLDVAVRNHTTQFVLGGGDAAAAACLELAAEEGMRARRLPIGGAFHTSLMAGVVEQFAAAAAAIPWRDPEVPVVLSTAPEQVPDASSIPRLLARSFVMPVRWDAAVERVAAIGVEAIVDAGPGDTLVRLARGGLGMPTRVLAG